MNLRIGCFFATALLAAIPAPAAEFPPPALGDTSGLGRNVQRTMRLLAESSPQRRNTVRVLFYGQSITEQGWWRRVADDLRARFPHANLVVENRALGGFASQLLVKTAEEDLYPFYPDLLVFHVYGAHDKYDDILRRVRQRTTAEILQQNDHVTAPGDFEEETDPAKLWPPDGRRWNAFMNHRWLPEVARRYGTELCDQRRLWKDYLKQNALEPRQLLSDGVHLNAHGEFLMAECVKAHLQRRPKLGPAPAEAWVKTYEVGKDVAWRGGRLRLEFEGNRVVALAKPGVAAPAEVRIDGRRPSEIPELYGFTRASVRPGGKWPPLAALGGEKPLVAETWTLDAVQGADDPKRYDFTLRGSVAGPDGAGRTDRRFVSNSGRVAIAPEDWQIEFALALAGVKPPPARFTAEWRAELRGADAFVSPGAPDPAVESAVVLASGLANGKHTLEIVGDERTPLAAIRVHCPPLGSAVH